MENAKLKQENAELKEKVKSLNQDNMALKDEASKTLATAAVQSEMEETVKPRRLCRHIARSHYIRTLNMQILKTQLQVLEKIMLTCERLQIRCVERHLYPRFNLPYPSSKDWSASATFTSKS